MTKRTAAIERKTKETEIRIVLDIDGEGISDCHTGIGFFDHLLDSFAKHGIFNLEVSAIGDLHVDYHHTVEDTGIALGQAIAQALGDKTGIRRCGTATVPLDEALARSVVDLSGRPYFAYEAPSQAEAIGGVFSFQLVEEFLRALAMNAGMNLHVSVLAGRDSHHIAEAIVKSLARALDEATQQDARVKGIPSTKGSL